jgi:hypothetical protein
MAISTAQIRSRFASHFPVPRCRLGTPLLGGLRRDCDAASGVASALGDAREPASRKGRVGPGGAREPENQQRGRRSPLRSAPSAISAWGVRVGGGPEGSGMR